MGTVVIEDAKIIFLNFSGKEGQYNDAGEKNFCVLLDVGLAQDLKADGWNVKYLKPQDGMEHGDPYLQVKVSYKYRPPKITLVTWNGKTPLGEEECGILDMIDIETVDLILNGSEWSVRGESGVKAYLKTLYVVLREDILDKKYRHLDELPTSSGRVIEGTANWIDGEVIERRAIES